jgi:hypothetical protein
LFVAVLHFVIDADKTGGNIAVFRWRMAAGSMLPAPLLLPRGMTNKR